jgi:hypothetical protein
LPGTFVRRPLDPAPRVPLHMFFKHTAGPVVENFVRVATSVAERERWLTAVA